ncbi:MAG: hypothetical protein RL336_1631 [Pseudomonadota bacterium]|jgi:uncharacterized membrane protein YhaH (DUF805 family)
MQWYLTVLKKYFEFSGRARRAEYWYFTLFNVIFSIVLGVIDAVIAAGNSSDIGVLGGLYSLALFIPSLAVAVRRLHDTGRSGWWMLMIFIPLIGVIVLLVFMVMNGEASDNEYGPDPKADASVVEA